MKTAIIVWDKDPAGVNIKSNLIEHFNLIKTDETYDNEIVYGLDKDIRLYTINERHVFAEGLDTKIQADFFIFATTHRSETGKPTLSVHAPGNWNKAELGGKEKTLCAAPAFLLKDAYLELKRLNNLEEFEVTSECTHHGPYLEKPAMFIEIGSSLEQWQNKDAGNIIASSIVNAVNAMHKKRKYVSCFVIGGGHYNQTANKIMERTDYSVGHICPKYMLKFLDEEMLKQAVDKTLPKPEIMILDWKGLGPEKARIVSLLDKMKIKYERINKLIKF